MRFSEFFQSDFSHPLRTRFVAFVLIVGVGSFFIRMLATLHQKSNLLHEERAKKEIELRGLTVERERLEKEIIFLQRQSALEREAKARLNYQKEGEEVVIVVPDDKKTAAVVEAIPKQLSVRERLTALLLRFLERMIP